ncbi:divalent cation tolerance protein CutA [Cryptosporangium sp. NPDC051539]|uniref:divalent cation tolerance protein CutA n=1 Tax=Cryptosporangium sp. NPDC051539 TaxID=3363962 RepID=UPI0037A57B2C
MSPRWNGLVRDAIEGRAMLHTRSALVPAIAERIRAEHPFVVPGVAVTPIVAGEPSYLQWVRDETQ